MHLVQNLFRFCLVILCAPNFRTLHNRIVFVCIKLSTRAQFYFSQNKLECKVDFGCVSEMPEHLIKFLYEEGVVRWWHGEKNCDVSIFFKLRVNDEMTAEFATFFSSDTTVSSRRVSISMLDIFTAIPCWFHQCFRSAQMTKSSSKQVLHL